MKHVPAFLFAVCVAALAQAQTPVAATKQAAISDAFAKAAMRLVIAIKIRTVHCSLNSMFELSAKKPKWNKPHLKKEPPSKI